MRRGATNRVFVLGRAGIEGVVDRVSHEFARSGVAVDTVERKQGRFAPFETIVFEEERHIQPVDFEEHIVGFTAVEDIVGECTSISPWMPCVRVNRPMEKTSESKIMEGKRRILLVYSRRVMQAPSALRRSSMCS